MQAQPSQESTSLLHRLAGPSSGKAGLAQDQSEINRIIAEVSKGSQFYENEKKKDKEVSARIQRILKQRDDVVRGVDLEKVEKKVDHIIEELESQRDLSQIIVHVDMDAFFANVELLQNPKLAGKPFGVGRGVLTTCSYEARRYGVRSGMAGFVAKKLCPDLIFVPINGARYSEMSDRVMDVFRRYDPTMAPAGCDEGYLNITSYCKRHDISAEDCVQQMRATVSNETKLTVSAGIASNKICSDKNKPNGQFLLDSTPNCIKEFMQDLSIRKVPGIGRVNERLLESIGIKTCGDIFSHRAVLYLMDKQFGLNFLLRTHLGIASNVVEAYKREERKSIGAERTFSPLSDKAAILAKLDEVAWELESDMEDNGWTGRTVTLKYKLHTYQVFTRAKSFDRWITQKSDLFATGKELLLPEMPLKIRLIGLRVTKLKDLRKSTSGIQRFFESVETHSPSKRRKVDEAINDDDNDDDDVMPGFREHEEEPLDLSQPVDDEVEQDDLAVADDMESTEGSTSVSEGHKNKRPPDLIHTPTSLTNIKSSKPPSTVIKAPKAPSSHSKPASRSDKTDDAATQQCACCPICARTLSDVSTTDNEGLNAHIDFCLSRGAILKAQGEAGVSQTASSPRKTRIDNKRKR